jgi:sulfur-carrier protein adenylyltransferase/sulfurtransferase
MEQKSHMDVDPSFAFQNKDQYTFIDVRQPHEWLGGHILFASLISQDQIPTSISTKIPDRSRPIIVYCQTGKRSREACKQLRDLGYLSCFSLAGGLKTWTEMEYPVEIDKEKIAFYRRYARHINLSSVGVAGQEMLSKAKVLIIGSGGLGSPCSLYLVAAGIGTLGIVDHDKVDISNLQRQILYKEAEVSHPKVACAKERLLELNSTIEVIAYEEKLSNGNAAKIVRNFDVVVCCTDNFDATYLINDACLEENKPLVYAAIDEFDGQLAVLNYKNSCCYRCIFNSKPPDGLVMSCSEVGVLGVLPGILGTLQALEVMKIILNIGEVCANKLLIYDGLTNTMDHYETLPDEGCKCRISI